VAEHYDVIIVGSGAGGGTLAHTLAPSGKRILLLERGDFLTRETDNWNPGPVFVDGKYTSFFPSIGAVNPAPHRHGQRRPRWRARAQPDVMNQYGGGDSVCHRR